MWAEKKRHKRRQKMSYRYAENQASTRKECLRKEEVNSAVNIIHSSLRKMQRDECLEDFLNNELSSNPLNRAVCVWEVR